MMMTTMTMLMIDAFIVSVLSLPRRLCMYVFVCLSVCQSVDNSKFVDEF